MTAGTRSELALVALSLFGLAGCPMTSTWTSPRTTPDGTVSHTIGVETMGIVDKEAQDLNADGDTADAFEDSGTVFAPFVFPAYIFRIGLGDRFDLGLKGSTAGTLQADFKFQIIKTPAFDLALDPSVQLSLINYASLPVLFGINLGESFSIYLGPRATWVFVFTKGETTVASGFAVGGTVGFRISPSRSFSLYPEITWFRSLDADANGSLATVGIGFSFGSGQPDYGPGSIEYVEGGQ